MPLVFLLFALFASVFTVGKTALEFTEPLFLVGSRMLFAGMLLLAYELYRNPKALNIGKKAFFLIVKLGIFNIYLTNAFEFWGMQYLSSFKTCFIYSLSPFASALISYMIFSEKMSAKKCIGLFIGCVGFIPILLSHEASESDVGNLLFFSFPELAVLAACLCSVYGWILLRKIVQEGNFSFLTANSLSMVIGGLFALVHSAFQENWSPIPTTNIRVFVECGIALVIISNFLAYNLYGYLLKRYSVTFMSFAGFMTPMFSALFGWVFLGEMVTIEFYVSSVVVFLGLYLFNREEIKVSAEA